MYLPMSFSIREDDPVVPPLQRSASELAAREVERRSLLRARETDRQTERERERERERDDECDQGLIRPPGRDIARRERALFVRERREK